MIPLRIQLAGFLCYREPQEACFDGRTLWMLAGPNGSGKSALFDAVTFALFGQHRGGKHNSRGLIHHDCDRLAIEYDFAIDEQHFRARRTLSRQGRSTRQVLSRPANAQADTEPWTTVTDTHTERGFAQWIDTHIALTYETFTASVLLMQGKADNLLLATPAQRHRLLCHIVGFDRIEELAEKAQHHLSQTEGAEKICQQQAQLYSGDEKSLVKDLRQRLTANKLQSTRLTARIDHLSDRLQHARRWPSLTRELKELQAKIDRQAEQIEEKRAREAQQGHDTESISHLPALRQLLDSIVRTNGCRIEIDRLESSQNALKARIQTLDTELKVTDLSITTTRGKLANVAGREKQLTEQQADQRLACASASRFADARNRLRQLRVSQTALQTRLQEVRQQQAALKHSVPCNRQLKSAHNNTRNLADQLARQEVLADHSRQQLQRFQNVVSAGERSCHYCQQPLDREHCVREEHRMKEELRNIESTLQQAQHQSAAATENERTLRKEYDRHRVQLETLSRREQQTAAEIQGTRIVEQELTDQCQSAFNDLPASGQPNSGSGTAPDWAAMVLPTSNELSGIQQQVRDTAAALKQLARETESLQTALGRSITQLQGVEVDRQTAAQRLDTCREQFAQQLGTLSGYLALHSSARSTVPPQWQDLATDDLSALIESLEAQSVSSPPATGKSGDTAGDIERMVQHQHSLQARRDLLTEEADRIPSPARCDPATLESKLKEATNQHQRILTNCSKLQSELAQAEQQADSHQAVLDRLQATQQQRRLWKRITKFLGRDGLQRALLEDTERAIVQYANTILDRLSGGQLYVELAQPDTSRSRSRKVLDLVARTTGSHAHLQDVAFLSGSQKFRVAVALSLAIGQFASNTRRPVQAVIIDEGFGCLDATNRHVMIQELQNLKGHLQRILLVSHQDEFVSAFPDGYRCELLDGATRLTPFHA